MLLSTWFSSRPPAASLAVAAMLAMLAVDSAQVCADEPLMDVLAASLARENAAACAGDEEEERCNYGPCDCQPRGTLFQWSYGASFSGGPNLEEPIVTDRPDFTEASSTVGKGVAQVEFGYTFTYVQRQPGFVCRINGQPASDPCVNTPPVDAYWGLWWSDGTSGTWTYSSVAAGSLTIPDGGYVAFAWQSGARSAPGAPATAHASSPTSAPTSTPTTGGGGGKGGGKGGGGGGQGGAGAAGPGAGSAGRRSTRAYSCSARAKTSVCR